MSKPTDQRDYPLAAFIEDGLLVISIGVNTLAHAFHQHPDNNPYNWETGESERTYTVSDPDQFAKDVLLEMQREHKDGGTQLNWFLDSMMLIALENGSTGILDEELDEEGDEYE